MKTNLGGFDGAFRTLLFVLAIIYVITFDGSWLWLIPGAIFFATATLTWCPLYAMFGIDTDKVPGVGH